MIFENQEKIIEPVNRFFSLFILFAFSISKPLKYVMIVDVAINIAYLGFKTI
ncbi:hypothetical protein LOR37_13380 [Clostridium estertheticum]|uniref:hypothetical protein n=1 Tax=Clostridium estertheticum TaxID=238834 RepID=UPI0022DCF556|nr:hypothetical protein [Clostridium estertheticum]WBL45682.1 hypothetical protein LOR37_13380 [Clostridium estertheticum]